MNKNEPGLIAKIAGAFVKRWGTPAAKRRVWDSEYEAGRWAQDRSGVNEKLRDPIYEVLERYSFDGRILDLGCGSGMTALEMKPNFREYVGVDISEAAVQLARMAIAGHPDRAKKAVFFAGDIFSFMPSGKFSVVLFRESIYYVPPRDIKKMLDRYDKFLAPGGVFIIRICDRDRHKEVIKLLWAMQRVTDSYTPDDSKMAILVCSIASGAILHTGTEGGRHS